MFEEKDENKTFEDELNTELELTLEEPVEDEEMTDAEVEEEIEEDNEEKIEDAIEQPFYATVPEFDELRDILVELDYRLFLINDNLVVIGRLNGADIEILVSSGDEENREYNFVKAPGTLNELKNIENVFYLSPDMTEEEQAEFEGKTADHASVTEYLMNLLPDTAKEELAAEEIEEEPIEEPVEEIEEEPVEETDEDIDDEEEE